MEGTLLGTKKEEAAEVWRELHNKGLHMLYSLPKVLRPGN
jgi:hypothetical protein